VCMRRQAGIANRAGSGGKRWWGVRQVPNAHGEGEARAVQENGVPARVV